MRKFLRKKGFTIIELVVVFAIIAVLVAMILPTLSTRDANKHASMIAARDFYSATQHLFTKYSKYEGELYPVERDEKGDPIDDGTPKLVKFDKNLGGNYPINLYTCIAMRVKNGKIEYVDATGAASPTIAEMLLYSQSSKDTETPFETMLKKDLKPLFMQQDGIYYAYIYFQSNATLVPEPAGNTNTVRVLAAAYCPTEIPPCNNDNDSYNEFRSKYLLLQENGFNANEDYLGVCSSYQDKILNDTIGNPGTYFSLYSIGATPI